MLVAPPRFVGPSHQAQPAGHAGRFTRASSDAAGALVSNRVRRLKPQRDSGPEKAEPSSGLVETGGVQG